MPKFVLMSNYQFKVLLEVNVKICLLKLKLKVCFLFCFFFSSMQTVYTLNHECSKSRRGEKETYPQSFHKFTGAKVKTLNSCIQCCCRRQCETMQGKFLWIKLYKMVCYLVLSCRCAVVILLQTDCESTSINYYFEVSVNSAYSVDSINDYLYKIMSNN